MFTLITGGAKCGKSRIAESCFDNFHGGKFYIATMIPYGDEAHLAIERHQKLRAGKGFETIEKYTDLNEINFPENCAVLLECMANLCANEMFKNNTVCDPTKKIINSIQHILSQVKMLVAVTNDVGCDGITYSDETERYIRVLGEINCRLAAMADNVIECVYGISVTLKGAL